MLSLNPKLLGAGLFLALLFASSQATLASCGGDGHGSEEQAAIEDSTKAS